MIVNEYSLPFKTPGDSDRSSTSFMLAARKIIVSRKLGFLPHIEINTAAIDEISMTQSGMFDASSMAYGEGISGRALAMKSETNVSENRPSKIRLDVTINVGASMLIGASFRGIILLPAFAGFGTLLYPISIIRKSMIALTKLDINSATMKCQVPASAAPCIR